MSHLIHLIKPKGERELEGDREPAIHPIHLAVEFKKLLDQKVVNSYSDIARR